MAAGFCSKCGSPLNAGVVFCPKCGSAVTAASASSPAALPAPPPPTFPAAWSVPPPPVAPKKSRTALYVVLALVAVIVVVVLVAAAALNNGSAPAASNSNGNNPPPPPAPETFIQSGTVWQIQAGHFEEIGLSVNSNEAISGTFTATNGITAYIMSPSQYQSFSGGGGTTSYVWTSGDVSTGSVNTNLASGTYYLVFENTNIITTTSVQVTSAIVGTASS